MPPASVPVRRPEFFDIVIFGSHFSDWLPALDKNSPIWSQLPHVGSVTHIGDDGTGAWPALDRRLVIPLREGNSDAAPAGGWGLLPDPAARATLGDKGWLTAFARAEKLSHLMPDSYASADEAKYPCVVKCTNLYAGFGVAIVHSREQLCHELANGYFPRNPVTLQEYIEAPTEFTTHCVCVGGRIAWHCTYEYDVPAADPVRRPHGDDAPRRVVLPDHDIADMQRFVARFRYDGIVNIDSKRRPSGRLAIMEINTRFGGSLFRAGNGADLSAALKALIANAKWRGSGEAVAGTVATEFEAAA